MKWGVRRTPEELGHVKKVLDESSKGVREVSSAVKRQPSKTVSEGKDVSTMSDRELQALINRMNLERQYKSLTTREISSGKDRVARILDNTSSALTVAGSAVGLIIALKQLKG